MPDLGKAVYTLVLNTSEFDAGLSDAEARAAKATTAIDGHMSRASDAITQIGPASSDAAAAVSVSSDQMVLDFEGVGTAAEEAAGTVADSAAEIGKSADTAAAEVDAAGARAGIGWKKMGASMAGISGRIKSINSGMAEVGRSMRMKVTVPIVAAAAIGSKMALDYSEKIKLLETQAGATGAEMNKMRGEVLKMADSGKFTHGPQALADALYHIESTGYRGAKALQVLRTASHGAMVGQADLESTTYALVSAQHTGIKGTETLAKTMGGLNAIVGAGDMRMQDLTSALSTGILPAAKSAGLGLKDVGAALDVMTSRGMPAQVSATRLGMTIALMQKQSPIAAKALEKLGIKHNELAHVMMGPGGLPAAIQLLHDRLLKVKDPAERADIVLSAFGGGRTGKAAQLLIQNVDDLHKRYEQVTKTGKNFNKQVLEAQEEPINKLKAAWAALQAEMIKLGDVAIPIFTKLARVVMSVLHWFEKLSPENKKILGILVLVAAAIGPVMGLVTAIGALVGSFMALGAAIMGVEAAASPVLAIVIIIAALGAALAIAYVKCKTFRDIVNATGHALLEVGKWIMANVIPAFEKMWDVAVRFGKFLWSIRHLLAVLFAPWLVVLVEVVKHWGQIRHAVGQAWKALQPFRHIAEILAGPMEAVFKIVTLPFRSAIQFIKTNWKAFFKWLGKTLQDLDLLFTHPLQAVKNLWHDLTSGILGLFKALWVQVEKTAYQFVLALLKVLDFTVLGHHIIPGVHKLVVKIQGKLDDLKPSTKKLGGAMATNLRDGFQGVNTGKGMAQDLSKGFNDNLNLMNPYAAAGKGQKLMRAQWDGKQWVNAATGKKLSKAQAAAAEHQVAVSAGPHHVPKKPGMEVQIVVDTPTKKTTPLFRNTQSTDTTSTTDTGTTDTTGKKKKPKPKPLIPVDMQIKLQEAKNKKNYDAEVKILGQEEGYLKKLLHQKGLSKEKRLSILRAIGGIDDQMTAIQSHIDATINIPVKFQVRFEKAQHDKNYKAEVSILRAEERYIEKLLHEKGISKTRRLTLLKKLNSLDDAISAVQTKMGAKSKAGTVLWTPQMRIRLAKAQRTDKNLKDDLAVFEAEQKYLRGLLKNRKLHKDQIAAIQEELTRVHKQIVDQQKKIKDQIAKEKQAKDELKSLAFSLFGERAGFFASFGPNAFTGGAPSRSPGTGPAIPSVSAPTPSTPAPNGRVPQFHMGGVVMPMHMAQGGWVPGEGDKDTVPAMLTPGEAVLSKPELRGLRSILGQKLSPSAAHGKDRPNVHMENHQHFNRETTDRLREARYAKVALDAVFDSGIA